MSTSIITPAMAKGQSRQAFRGKLECPNLTEFGVECGANKWKFVEKLGQFRIRYRCKVCGKTVQYDFANNPGHPYAVFGKNKFQQVVSQWKDKQKKGKHPVGVKP